MKRFHRASRLGFNFSYLVPLERTGAAYKRVRSSSLARELFTRFDTGHFCSKSFGAGYNNSMPGSTRPDYDRLPWKDS